ncbi:MAG: FtsX-like permease family protein, partial [Bacteroidota bacterium]
KVGESLNPMYPFEYKFLDQTFQEDYQREEIVSKLSTIFATLAILISCLGLLGLASFTAEQRTKEIGVRKVLGASVSHLVWLLSSDFTRLVTISFVIASPLAYYLMKQWLQDFEYQVDLSVGVFALAGVAALLIAWLTVGYQSIRTARANPVDSLRSE